MRVMAQPVLEHRLLLRPESELEGVRTTEVLDRILHEVPVPENELPAGSAFWYDGFAKMLLKPPPENVHATSE